MIECYTRLQMAEAARSRDLPVGRERHGSELGALPTAPSPARQPAAVLIPVVWRHGEPHLVLIQRTARGRHGGQISFPGGLPEPEDRDLLATALREAHEEIGLNPANVEVIAALAPTETVTTSFYIQPYVALVKAPAQYLLQATEVEAVLEVPLSTLLDLASPIEEEWQLPQGPRLVRFFPWQQHRIWGATARIIESLLGALRSGAIALPQLPEAQGPDSALPRPERPARGGDRLPELARDLRRTAARRIRRWYVSC